ELASDRSPLVRMQLAIALHKFRFPLAKTDSDRQAFQATDSLLRILDLTNADDALMTQIVWANLNSLLEDHSQKFLKALQSYGLKAAPRLATLMPRIIQRSVTDTALVPLLDLVLLDADESTARQCLAIVTRAIQNDELSAERVAALREQLG